MTRPPLSLTFRVLALLLLSSQLPSCGGGGSSSGGNGGGGTPPTIISVTVTCTETTITAGLEDQCSASLQGTGSFTNALTWATTAGTISSSGLFTAPMTASSATVTATSTMDSTKFGSFSITVNPPQKSAFTYDGITHTSWSSGEYSSTAGPTSEDALAATGAGWAGVLVTWYQANATSTTISPNITQSPTSPTDSDVIAAITVLHNKGLKVMLKPHVDLEDGNWRGTINPAPADVNAWFSSFTNFIVHFAQLAQNNNVEMLCFGTEYAEMSGSANLANWTSVIQAIRNVYTGKLAYAANATYATDEFTSVSFWNQVNVIGLDGYFPLTDHADPTIEQLVAAWSNNRNGENIVQDIKNFANAHPTQPIIFTEIGYRSIAGANEAPWNYSTTGPADDLEQQDCMEAMYEVWGQAGSVISGKMWWDWPVPVPSASDTDYNPRGKPAQTVLTNWQ